jgi:maltose alpha-D-glucosyltransferase/alpha-amylase
MLSDDPLWYKDAVIYEVHVRAFHDTVGDGVGDFRGLTRKLDYLEDLGVTCVWLLPFYPSPLKDDGYDIADYTSVNPQYGTLDDFKTFLHEAHRRGIRVITELVINHTSDQHPWFQRARRSPPGSVERDFYVWSDTPDRYPNVPLMFPDFETSNWAWDPVARQYYWHRFYSHQPDLNFDNPAVWESLFPVVDFWLGLGVDGMRLDAVPYLYEREGTSCEHLPETHAFLKALRKHVDERFPNRMFLAEANAWPEDAVAYFGDGDECHMAFHFPLMPRLFMALHQEDRFPLADILAQTPELPANAQWGLFLRNHDELTLAMVTDEERDYMFRAYTQDRQAKIFLGIRHRLAPLLSNDRRRIELMNALLFSMPGTPVLYYGDEIGMGDNIYLGDRNGVRTPMQWSGDRNAGFSRANPQKLYLPVVIDPEYHYEAVNVEAQQNNPSSLLWWMKRLIALRKRFKAFGRGSFEFVPVNNPKVLAFVRRYGDERILVVANLSRFVQPAELDLREFAGRRPEELFGRSLFPAVGDGPYPLTLGPHGFYWFSLAEAVAPVVVHADGDGEAALPEVAVAGGWTELTDGVGRDDLEAVLPAALQHRQPGGARRAITGCRLLDALPFTAGGVDVRLAFVKVEYAAGVPDTLLLPLTLVPADAVDALLAPLAQVGVARVRGPNPGVLVDPLAVRPYVDALVEAARVGRTVPTPHGPFAAVALDGFDGLAAPADGDGPPTLVRGDRNNLSLVINPRLVLKTYRRSEDGTNPDLEVGRFLSERQRFAGIARIVGYIEHRRRGGEPMTLGVFREFVSNQGDAWQHTLDQLSRFFERVAARSREQPPAPPPAPVIGPADGHGPDEWAELVGPYLSTARTLGRRTAELHAALAGDPADLAFAPEEFSKTYRRSLYQEMRNHAARLHARVTAGGADWPDRVRQLAANVAHQQAAILDRCRDVLDPTLTGCRVRVHGDYHLGHLLYTGKDFVLLDFEGDGSKTVGERRIKRSPFKDVASLVRSLDYAVGVALNGLSDDRGRTPGVIRPEDAAALQPWADSWRTRVAREFVGAYLEAVPPRLVPADDVSRSKLLAALMLERAMQEAEYDLDRRPEWAVIPLTAVLRLLMCDPAGGVCV